MGPGHDRQPGPSPEVLITMLAGALLLAYGVVALLLGGHDLATDATGGTVDGERWLGIEGNGWTNLLFMGVGALLIGGSARRILAKAVALVCGVVLGAASVIAIADGDDVLGIFAADGGTMLACGVAAVVLLAVAFAPTAPRRRDDSPRAHRTAMDWGDDGRFTREAPPECRPTHRTRL